MNRREALSTLGATGLATAFAGATRAADPVPLATVADAWPPGVLIGEAIRLAEAHVKEKRLETAGHYLSSAQLIPKKDGKLHWEVRWQSTDRLSKGDWFIIHVGMDKQAETIFGL